MTLYYKILLMHGYEMFRSFFSVRNVRFFDLISDFTRFQEYKLEWVDTLNSKFFDFSQQKH